MAQEKEAGGQDRFIADGIGLDSAATAGPSRPEPADRDESLGGRVEEIDRRRTAGRQTADNRAAAGSAGHPSGTRIFFRPPAWSCPGVAREDCCSAAGRSQDWGSGKGGRGSSSGAGGIHLRLPASEPLARGSGGTFEAGRRDDRTSSW